MCMETTRTSDVSVLRSPTFQCSRSSFSPPQHSVHFLQSCKLFSYKPQSPCHTHPEVSPVLEKGSSLSRPTTNCRLFSNPPVMRRATFGESLSSFEVCRNTGTRAVHCNFCIYRTRTWTMVASCISHHADAWLVLHVSSFTIFPPWCLWDSTSGFFIYCVWWRSCCCHK